jgi:hypothetical protein
MEVGIATASNQRSRLIVTFMEVVALPTSVNRLTDAGGLRCPSPLIKIEKQKKSPNLVRNQV